LKAKCDGDHRQIPTVTRKPASDSNKTMVRPRKGRRAGSAIQKLIAFSEK